MGVNTRTLYGLVAVGRPRADVGRIATPVKAEGSRVGTRASDGYEAVDKAMRAIVQRVLSASVSVGGREVGRCGHGLLLFVGVHHEDTEKDAAQLADRILGMRIFGDAQGKMNLAIRDMPTHEGLYGLEVLAVSNFTVYGDAQSRRPSFTDSAPFEKGKTLFERFVKELSLLGVRVETGEFGADMRVSLVNDGPVTLVVDTGK